MDIESSTERHDLMIQTKRFILYGRVQGVGMRYTISRIATSLGLHGYVKNKPEGTVECLVQGEDDTIRTFLLHIKNRTPGYIEHIHQEDVDFSKNYTNFQIRIF